MPRIDYHAELRLLVAVRGHPFARNAFDQIFHDMVGVTATMVDQPAAAQLMSPEGMSPYDALLLYDMPGVDFGVEHGRPAAVSPSRELRDGFRRLLESGKGIVALHHALAGWPDWDEYGEWLGGRFLYKPGRVRGEHRPDSGYCHDVSHKVNIVSGHPILAGLPHDFALTDELYLAEVFEDGIEPLLRSDYEFIDRNFWSAEAAMEGRLFDNDGWRHAPGSNIIAWVKRAIASPLVYLQPGDGPSAYNNPNYRLLVENAVRWAASDAARLWAQEA